MHVVHPTRVPWRHVISRVAQTLGVPVVPLHDWLTELEALTATPKAKETPALALLEAYREVDRSAARFAPRVSTGNALRESPTLAATGPLTEKDVDSWLSYWKSVSFISF